MYNFNVAHALGSLGHFSLVINENGFCLIYRNFLMSLSKTLNSWFNYLSWTRSACLRFVVAMCTQDKDNCRMGIHYSITCASHECGYLYSPLIFVATLPWNINRLIKVFLWLHHLLIFLFMWQCQSCFVWIIKKGATWLNF